MTGARGPAVELAAGSPLDRVDAALAALFALATLALYVALGQRGLYGDSAEFMLLLHDGAVGHKNHLAYIPLLRVASVLGASAGLSPFESARACSQLGAAFGTALLFLAVRRFGLGRRPAAWTTALVGTAPSVVFFATVVEVHAPYFALLGLAWLAAAHAARRPSPARGALLGAACGLAYLGHASGLVLPGPLLLVAFVLGRARGGWPAAAAACLLVHTSLVLLVPWWSSLAGHVASPAGAARFLAWWRVEIFERPLSAFLVLWDEWLLAYLPISLLWLRSFATARRLALLATAVLVPYLALSLALLAVYREFGAYQQAVVWLFAWCVVRDFAAPVRVLALGVALATGIWRVAAEDASERIRHYVSGLDTVAGSALPLLLVGGLTDYEHCFVARPGAAFENLAAVGYAEAAGSAAALQHLDARIAAHRARGGKAFLTAGAVGFLGTSATGPADNGFARLMEHLQARYRLQVAAADGFQSFELIPIEGSGR